MKEQLTFFLIDDDVDEHELFEIALEEVDANIQLITATNGRKALKMLEEGDIDPDYIFLDLNMPIMDGREFLSKIKTDQSLYHIPVIIFSTSSDPKHIHETKELGAIHFITKPSMVSELSVVLNNFIDNISNYKN